MIGKASIVCAAAAIIAGAALAQPAPPSADEPAVPLIQLRCASCHAVDQVYGAKKSPHDWSATLDVMAGYGAEFTPTERETILAYLAKRNGAE